jgi:hypothetical protein
MCNAKRKNALTQKNCDGMQWGMENTLTPQQVEAAAVKARLPLSTFIRNAGVSPSAFYRWRNEEHALRPLTLAKLADAVEAV